MTKLNDTLYPLYEEHVHLLCDGKALHADGLPQPCSAASLPDYYRAGLCGIYSLLERMVPAITCLSMLGIWHAGEDPLVVAFDLWVQTGDEGFYLPMSTAAALFRDNGIPYYHHPLIH